MCKVWFFSVHLNFKTLEVPNSNSYLSIWWSYLITSFFHKFLKFHHIMHGWPESLGVTTLDYTTSVPPKAKVYLKMYCKFSYRTYRNGLDQVPQSWRPLGPSNNPSHVSSIPFVTNLHFSMFVYRVRGLKNLFVSRR